MQKKIRNNNIMSVLLAVALLMLATPVMAELSTPFVIDGYVTDSNGDPCNSPWVQVTNTNTSASWYAANSSTSNYYRLVLDSDDVNAGDILHFGATDGTRTSSTDHTITQAEMDGIDGGGFECNITLDTHDILIKSDYTGTYDSGIRIDNATIERIPLDQNLTIGDIYTIKFKVVNNGTFSPETADITVKISNSTWGAELANYSKDVNSNHQGSVTWDTTGLASGDYYSITVNASIPMDSNPEDNTRIREVTLESLDVLDTTPPTVIDNTPTGTSVSVSTTITATFDESMNMTSVEGAFSTNPSITGSLGWAGDTMTFTPANDLGYSTTCEVTIGTGAEDLAGNPLAEAYIWDFTTGSEPDTTPPVITDIANGTPTASAVAINWTTDEASSSLVKYGAESGNYTDDASDGVMTTSHAIQLSGLTPSTTYYFVVNSTDAGGNANEGSEYSFTTAVMTEVGVTIDCATICSDPSCRTTVNITLNGIADYGSGTIHLHYNESVVNLVSVGLGDSMKVTANNSSGLVKISASNTDGLSGDVVFANVTFKPAGLTRGCSELNLTVETLYDRDYSALHTAVSNRSISIYESNLPEVTAPAASPSIILNDTAQMRPRKPGTNVTNLTVHVTDDTEVCSVYINLTPILGAGHDMVRMSGPDGQQSGDWYIVTNASYSSLVPYSLYVMANDYHGNWENGTCITLEVQRRGDVRSSSMAADNKVDSGDYFYIARYTVGLDPAPEDLTAQIVTADSWDGIDMADALYIAMYEAYKPPYGDYEAP